MINVIVTGGSGQLGSCLKHVAKDFPNLNFVFKSSAELDITNLNQVRHFFSVQNYDYCVNCAAYTKVDEAENKPDLAYKINETGCLNLANTCALYNTKLIHISTDFVFDGKKKAPYKETDDTNPLGVYGHSKLKGEEAIRGAMNAYFIIRTSWLYSEFANNFVKTMLRLAGERDNISVVDDQVGSPTYATDLAFCIASLIKDNSLPYGVYHYANKGSITWFDFCQKIFEVSGITTNIRPITSSEYPTAAKRPSYSVLDATKITRALKISYHPWEEALKRALKK